MFPFKPKYKYIKGKGHHGILHYSHCCKIFLLLEPYMTSDICQDSPVTRLLEEEKIPQRKSVLFNINTFRNITPVYLQM